MNINIPRDVGTICCILTQPSDAGQRGSFICISNIFPAEGFDFTCSIASFSVRLAGSILPVEPRETSFDVAPDDEIPPEEPT